MNRSANRGIALIVVLGVLVVLALLGATFAVLARVEREVSRNYLDLVRARLIAHAGVEKAVSALPNFVLTDPFGDPSSPLTRSWVYYGNEVNEDVGTPQVDISLEIARNPSFAWEDEDPQDPSNANFRPKQLSIDGIQRGFSGTMSSGTYGRYGDLFTLRVSDLSGRIFVNDGVTQYRGNDSSVSQTLKRVLNRLGDVVGAPNVGDTIIQNRPSLGYSTDLELQRVLGDDVYRRVRDYVTTVAWVDWNVCNPVPLSVTTAAEYRVTYYRDSAGGPLYRRGRGKDAWNTPVPGYLNWAPNANPRSLDHAIYGLDELNPQWIEVVGRAPVNVNVASRQVLIALISDLQGFFVSYRRRNNIEPAKVGGYWFASLSHTFSPAAPKSPVAPYNAIDVPEGDEYGWLYKTVPFRHPTGTTGWTEYVDYVDAGKIADEIIACRKKLGPYASLPFGGPFQTWRQFNAFCDNLVLSGVIRDDRRIFFDYNPNATAAGNTGSIVGFTNSLLDSGYQRQLASQAIADVLKANFNPNLHLNELNPDRNLHLLVDKTDLIANSTEFLFTSNGSFEIESIGRVLRPDGGSDAFAAADNQIVAEERILAGVQLFQLYRETSQKQFYSGVLRAAAGGGNTNSNFSLEIGPEVDNGRAPMENEWDGYIAFPTLGGLGQSKNRGELVYTQNYPDARCLEANFFDGADITVHFQWDFDAHHHGDGRRSELATRRVPGEVVENFADPGESEGGPYSPIMSNGRYRLARSFRLPTAGSTSTMPGLFPVAPMDLRIDGGYVERHSAPAWWISPSTFVRNGKEMAVVSSFWVKPSFPPDRSGKPRLYLNANRWCQERMWRWTHTLGNEAYFAMYFNAGHEYLPNSGPPSEYMTVYSELQYWDMTSLYWGFVPFRPDSLIFGRGYGPSIFQFAGPDPNHYKGCPRYWAMVESTSNHEAHGDGFDSLFRWHEWTHVVILAKPRPVGHVNADTVWLTSVTPQWNRMLINGGQTWDAKEYYACHDFAGEDTSSDPRIYNPDDRDRLIDYSVHDNGERNCLRFGSPSKWVTGHYGRPLAPEAQPYVPSRGNFSCDSTVDEFLLWGNLPGGNEVENVAMWARDAWDKGRYYLPADSDDCIYTSAAINFQSEPPRSLPPASSVSPPGGGLPSSGSTIIAGAGALEILGMSWTFYGESASDTGLPYPRPPAEPVTLWPSLSSAGNRTDTYMVGVQMSLDLPGGPQGPYLDDGYSQLRLQINPGESFKYRAQFLFPYGEPGAVISTPVLDDVTFYYRSMDEAVYLYYVFATTLRED